MENKKRWLPNWREGGWILLIGVLDAVAFINYNIGLTVSETSLVVTLTSLFAVFTIFWGIVIFKEKITRFQWVGLLCIFSGLVLISV
jgi:drug/metabolite transporter (DMT)-like permease